MKRLLVCIGLLMLVSSNTVFAEKLTVTATGYHTMSETESKAQAKESAKLKALYRTCRCQGYCTFDDRDACPHRS